MQPTHGERKPSSDDGRVRDVVISAAAMRRNRLAAWRGAFSDFAAVPVLVLLSFAVRAVVSIRADQIHTIGSLNGARRAAAHIVGKQASSSALQAVATGLVSVTSITFSVQLLAVQRTASNVSV